MKTSDKLLLGTLIGYMILIILMSLLTGCSSLEKDSWLNNNCWYRDSNGLCNYEKSIKR